jgi:hypothetical protein
MYSVVEGRQSVRLQRAGYVQALWKMDERNSFLNRLSAHVVPSSFIDAAKDISKEKNGM